VPWAGITCLQPLARRRHGSAPAAPGMPQADGKSTVPGTDRQSAPLLPILRENPPALAVSHNSSLPGSITPKASLRAGPGGRVQGGEAAGQTLAARRRDREHEGMPPASPDPAPPGRAANLPSQEHARGCLGLASRW